MNPLWPRRRARLSRPLGELIERKRRRTPVLLRLAKIEELRDAHQCRYAPSQGNSRQRLASVDSRLGGWQPRHARHETGDEGGSASAAPAWPCPEQPRGPHQTVRPRSPVIARLRDDARQGPEKALNSRWRGFSQRPEAPGGPIAASADQASQAAAGLEAEAQVAQTVRAGFREKAFVPIADAGLHERPAPAKMMVAAGVGVRVEARQTNRTPMGSRRGPLPPNVPALRSGAR